MSSNNKLKGRASCETHDCYPVEHYANGRVKKVAWIPKSSPAQPTPMATTTPKFQSWVSVYHIFTSIADTILELPEGIYHDYAHVLINDCVNSLYAQHEGEEAWDIAYTKWIEPSDDDEEV